MCSVEREREQKREIIGIYSFYFVSQVTSIVLKQTLQLESNSKRQTYREAVIEDKLQRER